MTRFLMLLVVLLVPVAAAARSPEPVRGVLTIEGKQVALPPGLWLRVGKAETDSVVSVALLQLQSGAVAGGVLVQVNRDGTASDWGTAPACERTDLPFARVRYASDHDGSCAYAAVMDAAGAVVLDPAWAEARATAQARGWALPARWAEAAIRASDPQAAVQVRYAFALAPDAPLPLELPAWTEVAQDKVELGLLNQLDPTRALPPVGAEAPEPDAVQAARGSSIPRAVKKTLTFRVIATTIDFTTNLIFIGDLTTAALLSTWNTLTGPWIYLAHELAWDYFGTPAAQRLELPGMGGISTAHPS